MPRPSEAMAVETVRRKRKAERSDGPGKRGAERSDGRGREGPSEAMAQEGGIRARRPSGERDGRVPEAPPAAAERAAWRVMVRKGGFEPPRSCERQPLKLVRLPVPPLPQGGPYDAGLAPGFEAYFFGVSGAPCGGACVGAGADAGAGVAGLTGAGFDAAAGFGAGAPLTTDAGPRCPSADSASANAMKSAAATVVTRVSSVAPERAPNAVWLLLPPNADAMSPPLPCWSNTTSSRTRQVRT